MTAIANDELTDLDLQDLEMLDESHVHMICDVCYPMIEGMKLGLEPKALGFPERIKGVCGKEFHRDFSPAAEGPGGCCPVCGEQDGTPSNACPDCAQRAIDGVCAQCGAPAAHGRRG